MTGIGSLELSQTDYKPRSLDCEASVSERLGGGGSLAN
jgi:hypothetical protein